MLPNWLLCAGYDDYGDYWRSNYETNGEGKFAYSRNDLMTDVERLLQEVWLTSCTDPVRPCACYLVSLTWEASGYLIPPPCVCQAIKLFGQK